jgi:plastocyanin domain-containing protein
MNVLIIDVVGVALIALIVWWFWIAKGKKENH